MVKEPDKYLKYLRYCSFSLFKLEILQRTIRRKTIPLHEYMQRINAESLHWQNNAHQLH